MMGLFIQLNKIIYFCIFLILISVHGTSICEEESLILGNKKMAFDGTPIHMNEWIMNRQNQFLPDSNFPFGQIEDLTKDFDNINFAMNNDIVSLINKNILVNNVRFVQKLAAATQRCPIVSNHSKWLGRIDASCSAVLIAPSWALTANHCSVSTLGLNKSMLVFDNYFDFDPVNLFKNNGSCCLSKSIYSLTPKIEAVKHFNIINKKHDIKLIKLKKSLSIPYAHLPSKDEFNDFNNFDDEKTFVTQSIGMPYYYPVTLNFEKSKKVECFDFNAYPSANKYIKTDKKQGMLCDGDSGGAVTVQKNNKLIQVGIISHICGEPKGSGCGSGNCNKISNIARYQKLSKEIVKDICYQMKDENNYDFHDAYGNFRDTDNYTDFTIPEYCIGY